MAEDGFKSRFFRLQSPRQEDREKVLFCFNEFLYQGGELEKPIEGQSPKPKVHRARVSERTSQSGPGDLQRQGHTSSSL